MTESRLNKHEKTRIGAGKPGPGRPKGSPNRASVAVREALALLVERNIEKLEQWFAEIEDPARRCEIFVKLFEYHIPKLGRTEISADVEQRHFVAELPPVAGSTEEWLRACDEWRKANGH